MMLATILFSQENDFFELSNGRVIEVNSLCASRTFMKYGVLSGITCVKSKPPVVDITIVRDEYARLLSAYNKKIIADDDWKKSFLRAAVGLRKNMSFESFVQTLVDRKKRALFIDKHFRPCTSVGTAMTLEGVKYDSSLGPLVWETLSRKTKSSAEVAAKKTKFKEHLSDSERRLVSDYLRLYET